MFRMRAAVPCAVAICAFAATASVSRRAHAEAGGAIVVWPTLTPAGDDASPLPLHKPKDNEQPVVERAQELDATLRDAAQDLGYTLDVADPGPAPGHTRDSDLVERAAMGNVRSRRAEATPRGGTTATPSEGSWVVSARIEQGAGDTFIVRIVAVPPLGQVLRVREELVKGADVSVRGLVMLRDLLTPGAAIAAAEAESAREQVNATANLGIMSTVHSPGRAVLAANGALFGAFAGYGIQRSSGSDDPRLLYPLLALGTGIGLGASLLAADEWNIGTGDAWTLAAGAWWGAGSGILIANGRHVEPLTDRYSWGIGGGLIGLGLATVDLTHANVDEGGATLVHSGATLGFVAGGIGELIYRGTIVDTTPYTGAGYGTAIGLVAAGALASQIQVSPSRVMLVDLGAGLGALAGAAAASPLIFGAPEEGRTRAFLTTTLGGTVVGGSIAWFATRSPQAHVAPTPNAPHSSTPAPRASFSATPFGGVIGASATPAGYVSAYGIGAYGDF